MFQSKYAADTASWSYFQPPPCNDPNLTDVKDVTFEGDVRQVGLFGFHAPRTKQVYITLIPNK